MWWIVGLVAAVLLAALVAPPPPGRRAAARAAEPDPDDGFGSALDDPVETLLRGGYIGDLSAWRDEQDGAGTANEDRG